MVVLMGDAIYTSKYRIKLISDGGPYVPHAGDDVAELARIIDADRVWGYVIEQWVWNATLCPYCGEGTLSQWEEVESSYGYLGTDKERMIEEARVALPAGVSAPVVDEDAVRIGPCSARCTDKDDCTEGH